MTVSEDKNLSHQGKPAIMAGYPVHHRASASDHMEAPAGSQRAAAAPSLNLSVDRETVDGAQARAGRSCMTRTIGS